MTQDEFKTVVNEMFTQCCDLLSVKEKEYSDGKDRLVQFKNSGILLYKGPIEALAGMMVKHTTKLYSMLDDDFGTHTREAWEEVLNDHTNYLFLLKAMLIDEGAI